MALTEKLTAIGDAIREKNGSTNTYTLDAMPSAILAIQTSEDSGEGGVAPTATDLAVSGDLGYWNYKGKWDWAFKKNMDLISTSGITSLRYSFDGSEIETIPFDLNFEDKPDVSYMFYGSKIKEIANVTGTFDKDIRYFFNNASYMEHIPPSLLNAEYEREGISLVSSYSGIFQDCHSLREIPVSFLKKVGVGEFQGWFNRAFENCYMLDELILPFDSNITFDYTGVFNYAFENLYRASKVNFNSVDTVNSTVSVTMWDTTVDLSQNVGYGSYSFGKASPDKSKQVTNATTYQALKNDPDWWTTNVYFSRYNHDSAVKTLLTLPDTNEAFIKGCNIKFRGNSGRDTDGGAISNLTAEEIAVATAKCWTVAFV